MAEADRVERILTMLLLEQLGAAPQSRKIDVLLRAGFKNAEVATLLGTSAGVVAQTAYEMKKGKTKAKTKTKGKKKR